MLHAGPLQRDLLWHLGAPVNSPSIVLVTIDNNKCHRGNTRYNIFFFLFWYETRGLPAAGTGTGRPRVIVGETHDSTRTRQPGTGKSRVRVQV